jgi:hypothetical protein
VCGGAELLKDGRAVDGQGGEDDGSLGALEAGGEYGREGVRLSEEIRYVIIR